MTIQIIRLVVGGFFISGAFAPCYGLNFFAARPKSPLTSKNPLASIVEEAARKPLEGGVVFQFNPIHCAEAEALVRGTAEVDDRDHIDKVIAAGGTPSPATKLRLRRDALRVIPVATCPSPETVADDATGIRSSSPAESVGSRGSSGSDVSMGVADMARRASGPIVTATACAAGLVMAAEARKHFSTWQVGRRSGKLDISFRAYLAEKMRSASPSVWAKKAFATVLIGVLAGLAYVEATKP